MLSSAEFKQLDEHRQLAIKTFLYTYDGKIENDD